MRFLVFALLLVACAKKLDDFHVAGKAALSVCAAYSYDPKSGAVVIQRDGNPGDVIDYKGQKFNVHRSDCVTIAQPTIHWTIDGDVAFIGFGDSASLGERSEKRMSQYDAIFVGDALVSVSLYEAVMRDTLWLGSSHRDDQAKLFATLTGTQPPH
jgi:hypothetical protein